MISNSLLLLNCLALLLAFPHLATCVYPTPETRPRFNCPQAPPPVGVNALQYESLYKFCVSKEPSCDCYEEPNNNYGAIVRPTAHVPKCDIARHTDQNNLELQAQLRFCEDRCMCYGGPTQNWSRWPWGPTYRNPGVHAWKVRGVRAT